VSPYFFLWTLNAVTVYYTDAQKAMHRSLLSSVRETTRANGSSAALEAFAQSHAGEVLMYGMSLSKQFLDPAHYPQDLEVRNNHKPFVYR
jgi:hypothetical protein